MLTIVSNDNFSNCTRVGSCPYSCILLILFSTYSTNCFLFSQGKAHGRRSAIYIRSLFQSQLQTLGIYIQKNAGKILFVAIIVLSAFCVGLKSATIHSKVQQLWIQGKIEVLRFI